MILVRDRGGLEVLMVERHAAANFASALVFPGGVVDADDHSPTWADAVVGAEGLSDVERAIRIAGYRELYEETSLLLAEGVEGPLPGDELRQCLERAGARLDLSAMHPFAHWITPEGVPKRYDTHFRLCGVSTERVAASDGRETVSAEWLRPKDALAMGARGERKVLFPTRLNLELLAASGSVDEAVESARRRRIVTVTPRVDRRADGAFITIPHDAGYGVVEARAGV